MTRAVVMGVAGCGKSTIAEALAARLGLPLIEGDAFHPESNQQKMRNGIALTDADRAGWLDTLGRELAARPAGALLTCSALRRAYREQLRGHVAGLRFVFLDIDRAEALRRVGQRGAAHLFPTSLVDSQFATLESPLGEPGVLRVDATAALDRIVDDVARWLTLETA